MGREALYLRGLQPHTTFEIGRVHRRRAGAEGAVKQTRLVALRAAFEPVHELHADGCVDSAAPGSQKGASVPSPGLFGHDASMEQAAPFAALSPDTILDAIEALGFACDGRTLALSSYENRVYQVGLDSGEWLVAKFYRPARWTDAAIAEEHDFALELAAHEIPVVAPLLIEGTTLHEYEEFRYALFPRQGGHWPELSSSDEREMMGRFIGRLHAVGATGRFEHRPDVDIERLGDEPRAFLLDSEWIPQHICESYAAVSEQLLDEIERVFDEVGSCSTFRIHGDCHLGNTLWTDSGPHFVDLDDCVNGPAVQDLWMLLSGEKDAQRRQLDDVLAGYETFRPFEFRETRLIEPLRALRMVHYTAWVARRWIDPAFPRAFPWLAENRYWEQHVLDLKEQLGAVMAA